MGIELTQEEGEFLVRLARRSVEEYLGTHKLVMLPENTPVKLMQQYGVFVTLNAIMHGRKKLRGCIGYPYPTMNLAKAVIECAVSASTRDPRFQSLSVDELDRTIFEVSILTPPRQIKVENPKYLPSKINVGKDGLIVEKGINRGLLLPQVPVEYQWDEEEFLSQACMKAGLTPDCWLVKATKIFKFQCVIASEKSPKGLIELKGPSLIAS